MKKFLSVLLSIIMIIGIFPVIKVNAVTGNEYTDGYYTYTIENNCATITGVDQLISDTITIPATLGGYNVTAIGEQAFYGCNSLKAVIFPECVTSIGRRAFSYCEALESIEISNSVTSIGRNAFSDTAYYNNISNWENGLLYIGSYLVATDASLAGNLTVKQGTICVADYVFSGCKDVTSISFSESVKSIGQSAFFRCSSLTEIYVDTDNAFYSSSDGVLFNKDKTLLIEYPIGKTQTSYVVPDSVTSIGNYAFYECDFLTSVTFLDNVTNIGDGIFGYCDSITTVNISSGLTHMGFAPFMGCVGLTAVNVDDKNQYYCSQDGILFNKEKTEIICYPAAKEETSYSIPDSVTAVGNYAFACCANLTSVELNSSLKTISEGAFGMSAIESIVIPESVELIGGYAFCQCVNLKNLVVNSGQIDESAFAYCDALEAVEIGDNVTSLGEGSFYYCLALKTAKINCRDIGSQAFAECTSLKVIEFGENVKSIGDYAFMYTAVEEITIPETVETLGYCVFLNCSALKTATLNCENVGYQTFVYCEALKTVEFGENVKIIGEYAFAATALENIVIPETVETIGEGAFNSCPALKTATVKCENISDYAFAYCEALETVELSTNVKTIGEGAFGECSSLKLITLPVSIKNIGADAFDCCDLTAQYCGTKEQWDLIEHSDNLYENIKIVYLNINLSDNQVFTAMKGNMVYSKDGENLSYQWYGCNSPDKSDAVMLAGATNSEFNPYAIGSTENQTDKFKYYYCIATDNSDGETTTESPLCENAIKAIAETSLSEIDYENLVIYSDSIKNINDYSSIVKLSEVEGAVFTMEASHSYDGVKTYGTGSKLIISNNAGSETVFDVVIYGDVNGDSVVDVLDSAAVAKVANYQDTLNGLYGTAADINGDGLIDVSDYSSVVNKALEK